MRRKPPPDQIPAPELRRSRRRSGLRSAVAVALAATLCILVNVLADHIGFRKPVSSHLPGKLSERTRDLLRQTDGEIEIIAYFDSASSFRRPVEAVLTEFRDAAEGLGNIRLATRLVDADRKTDEAAELVRRHGVDANCVVVRTPAADSVIPEEELVEQDLDRDDHGGTTDFIGEQRIATAIWNLTRASHPVVYFLQGSGEYDPDDYDSQIGYSAVAKLLRQDFYTVRTLDLARTPAIPPDCAVLVLAGPRAHLPVRTIELLANHLASGGRLLALLDDPGDEGLVELLKRWGVTPAPLPQPAAATDYAIVSKLSPITRALTGVVPVFGKGCRLTPDPAAIATKAADKPNVDVLLAPRRSRAALAFAAVAPAETPAAVVPTTEAAAASGADKPAETAGPAPQEVIDNAIAVAIRRGGDDNLADRTLRMRAVVVGDSEFASNAMAGHGGNLPFFLACVRWLSERGTLIGHPPVTFRILDSGLTPKRWPVAAGLVVVAWPLAILLVGYVVFRRR